MTLRAAIFDVYKTILEVGPPPVDAPARWHALCREFLGSELQIDLAEFGGACEQVIAHEHASARAAGITWPEIFWPEVVRKVLPALAACPAGVQEEFMFRQVGLWHTVQLMPGAAATLRQLSARGILLGIASNAQPYTLRELADGLATGGLTADIFTPDLCFWSFVHGFSKPDPHVFRLLTARLQARGISPAETLMVGDRLDNDIGPAHTQGWRTWHLTSRPQVDPNSAGGWAQLAAHLEDSAC